MTDETTPDAVTMLQRMHARAVESENHGDVPRIGSDEVLAVLRATEAERARHAEEVARLEERCQSREEQLGKLSELYDVTQERLEDFDEREPDARLCAEWAATVALKATDVYSAARRYLCGESRGIVTQAQQENDSLRDQLRKVEGELEECEAAQHAEQERDALRSLLPDVRACARFTYRAAAEGQLVPEFSSAQKLLAADFLREPCPECDMPGHHKLSCSRGGSKGGRFSVSLDSQGGEGE